MKTENDRLEFLKKDAVQGFTKFIGMRTLSLKPGEFKTRVKLEQHHYQQDGFAHAGIIATMADHTAGYAAFSLINGKQRVLTIEFKINYFRPASGDHLECRGWVTKPGKQIMFTEAEVYDVVGRQKALVAKAMHTMAIVPVEKVVGGRSRRE
jgi:uncharacterized protein (TIGR00369 family)